MPASPTDPSSLQPEESGQAGWKVAAERLVSARLDLFRIELKEFQKESSRKAVCIAFAAVAGACAWLLVLAGLVPILADATQLPWPATALILAGCHIMIAIVFLSVTLRKSSPAFSATLAEFQKDREWLKELPNPKS